MAAKVFTVDAARQASLNLTEGKKGLYALHDTVVAYRAGRRAGTACTKTRNEVAGSGKKLWRQKGTGRARMGSVRAPHWRGGGTVWGPRPRDYSKKVNIKVKRLAFRAALTARINDGDVLLVSSITSTDGKTKSFLKLVQSITDAKKVLIVALEFDALTLRAAGNLPGVELITAAVVNGENLLNFDKVILTQDALAKLAERTA